MSREEIVMQLLTAHPELVDFAISVVSRLLSDPSGQESAAEIN